MNKFYILFLFLALLACKKPNKTVKQVTKPPVIKKPVSQFYPVKVPAWLTNLPAGNKWAISIVPKTFNEDIDIEFAKKQAAVFLARNTKGLAICKKMFVMSDYSELMRKFNVFVSQDTTYLRQKYNNLKLNSKANIFGDARICLFTEKDEEISNQTVTLTTGKPKWFHDTPKILKNGKAKFYGSVQSTKLHFAWEDAINQARYGLANYIAQNVKSGTFSNNYFLKKMIELTTEQIIEKIRLSNAHIAYINKGNASAYTVWIEIEI